MLDGDKESLARDKSVFHSVVVGAADRLFAKSNDSSRASFGDSRARIVRIVGFAQRLANLAEVEIRREFF